MSSAKTFRLSCRKCERLATFLDEVSAKYPQYHAKPVPPFGDQEARLLIVGLAPGMHGANATGRPFTGDYAGILLYETLYKFGFSTAPTSVSKDDGLRLINCRITNAVKCLPPQNKPVGAEITMCNEYLRHELAALEAGSIILVLGTIAHNAVLRALGKKLSEYKFGHGKLHKLDNQLRLLDSYHCSRYNTQTKRLTTKMFENVFEKSKELLES